MHSCYAPCYKNFIEGNLNFPIVFCEKTMNQICMLNRYFFKDEDLTHDQVFDELANTELSCQDAAKYLEISIVIFSAMFRKEYLGLKLPMLLDVTRC